MDAFLSRLHLPRQLNDWAHRNRGKLLGVVAGTFGLWLMAAFLVVVVTGVPYGGERLSSERTIVYPNL